MTRRIYSRSRDGGESFYEEGCHAELFDGPCNAGQTRITFGDDRSREFLLFAAPAVRRVARRAAGSPASARSASPAVRWPSSFRSCAAGLQPLPRLPSTAMAAACKKFRLVIRFMFGISSMMECLLTEECKPFAATRLRIMRRECLKVSAIVGLGGGMRKCGPRSLGKDIMSGAL